MRLRPWLYASVVAGAFGLAMGQPHVEPAEVPAAGSDSGSGPPPKAAGASAVESSDVPAWQPGPARFAVTPLENHTGGKTLDWIVAEAPFEIAEKTEAVLGLEPAGGSRPTSRRSPRSARSRACRG